MKITLEKSDVSGWRVNLGPEVKFTGKRPFCKRMARILCAHYGLKSWWNRKASGELVEVPL